MVADDPGIFIDSAKLDLAKYASRPSLAKALFHYLLYVTNDTLKALDLAAKASEAASGNMVLYTPEHALGHSSIVCARVDGTMPISPAHAYTFANSILMAVCVQHTGQVR